MSIIIRSGFQEVKTDFFRKESLAKGAGLLKSCHVDNVYERADGSFMMVCGRVLWETPGAQSAKNKTNFYEVTVELNVDRSVRDTNCNCKDGKGFCKHAAAVCLFVNDENTRSKTDQPMLWNKPTELQLAKYAKGCSWNVMYPHKIMILDFYELNNITHVENVHVKDLEENANCARIMKSELSNMEKRVEREKIMEVEKNRSTEIINQLLELQKTNQFPIHYCYDALHAGEEKMKLMPKYKSKYNQCTLITLDEQKLFDICLLSMGQSECASWYRERFIRITCSSRAHRIRTRQDLSDESLQDLANQFLKQKHNGAMTKAMIYGINMEKLARNCFEELIRAEVRELGLIVSRHQPFLACSPDGVITNGNDFELLEIKCPETCEKAKIVDRKEQITHVPYLFYDENGNLTLKESRAHYTQIQVSLYILGISVCNFFVYSEINYVHLRIQRNEDFLSSIIPKIKFFYLEYFYRLLTASSTEN